MTKSGHCFHPTVVRTMVNFRDGFALFLLINLETLMAVIARTSSSSTATSLSPTRILEAITEESFTAWTTGAPSSGVSMTTPNFPGGAKMCITCSVTFAFGSGYCASNDAPSSFIAPRAAPVAAALAGSNDDGWLFCVFDPNVPPAEEIEPSPPPPYALE